MPDSSLHTTQLRRWAARMRAGDRAACDEMLRAAHVRLQHLARKMMQRFPGVARWEETGDLLQNALLRLLRALQDVEPTSVRDFFGLAAKHMRLELLDLARRYRSRHINGPSHLAGAGGRDSALAAPDPAAPAEDPDELDRWSAFHEAVERLPVEQREVVGLIYYHGWTQAEVAEYLCLSKRTVQRYWATALLTVHEQLKEP
jgi:RNA polymerase sigma factor (sigma-70 family)